MFRAFEDLYPDEARLIRGIRKGHAFGSSVLYGVLSSMECAIFIERVIPFVDSLGIPVVNLHDAVLVPAPEAEKVRRIVEKIASSYLGFRPRVGIKPCVPPVADFDRDDVVREEVSTTNTPGPTANADDRGADLGRS